MPANHFIKRGPAGCLLLHGFTASPNELLPLGKHLSRLGVTVSIPTLPGHGTHAADLFNYTWRDWFECAKAAYAKLAVECEEVFACGLSMGGALALHLAAHRPVQGVVALSAPVQFVGWKKQAVQMLGRVVRFRRKRDGEDVRDQAAKEKLGSYRRYPYYSVEQLFEMVEHVRADLPEIVQPILIMHSRQDHTVPFENADVIYELVSSVEKRLVALSESYHIITVDVEKEKVRSEIVQFLRAHARTELNV